MGREAGVHLRPNATVVDAGQVTNTPEGANPHLWYSPSAVTAVADAVTAALTTLAPDAATYFTDQRSAFTTTLKPYDEIRAPIKASAPGKPYAATEGVFDYLAQAVGLVNETPQGYRNASANQSDPSPADLEAFRTALAARQFAVLVYDTQTQGISARTDPDRRRNGGHSRRRGDRNGGAGSGFVRSLAGVPNHGAREGSRCRRLT